MMCSQRLFLLRCFVGILGTGLMVSVIDLTYCRWHGGSCQVQRKSVGDSVMAATVGISGLLIKLPD